MNYPVEVIGTHVGHFQVHWLRTRHYAYTHVSSRLVGQSAYGVSKRTPLNSNRGEPSRNFARRLNAVRDMFRHLGHNFAVDPSTPIDRAEHTARKQQHSSELLAQTLV